MNKKRKNLRLIQSLCVIVAIVMLILNNIYVSNMEKKNEENVTLKKQIIELKNNYLELQETQDEQLNHLKEEQDTKEQKIEDLNNKISTYESEKSDWNKKIAELEK